MPSFLLRVAARLVLGVFFRRVRILGSERMPMHGPVVVVANHFNGLVDAALLFAHLPRRPSFLAKSTLWEIPLLQPILDLAGAIPVIRRQDVESQNQARTAERNSETFARCEALLVEGGVVALFPEGITHEEPALQPLRSGAARIALRARARAPEKELFILPVGLVFDEPERFRSQALLEIGHPLPVLGTSGDCPESVRELTGQIRAELEQVAPSYASWEELRLFERASELYRRSLQTATEESCRDGDEEALASRRELAAAYDRLRCRHPDEVAGVARSFRSYDRLLETFGVRHDLAELSGVPWRAALTWALGLVATLLVLLPLAFVGTLLNWLPYRIPGFVASRWAEGREVVATYKVFVSVVVFPLFWLLESCAVALATGLTSGIVMFVLAPLAGLAALSFHERRRELWERTRAWVLLRRGRLAEELDRRRRDLLQRMDRLRELDRLDPVAGHSAPS